MKQLACLVLSGCALAGTPSVTATAQSPQADIGRDLRECKTSSGGVKADVAGALAAGLLGAILTSDAQPHQSCFIDCHETSFDSSEQAWGIGMLVVATAYTVSAFVGHSRVTDCDELHAQYDQQVYANPTAFGFAPMGYPVYTQPPAYGPQYGYPPPQQPGYGPPPGPPGAAPPAPPAPPPPPAPPAPPASAP